MKLLMNIAIRFILYCIILVPTLTNIFSGTGKFIAPILAFVLGIIIISILEFRGITKKLVGWLTGLLGVGLKSSTNAVSNKLGQTIAPEETLLECDNCGTQVTLKNGAGVCEACGTEYKKEVV